MGSTADKLDLLAATARERYPDDPLADRFMVEYRRDVPVDDVEDRDLGDVVSVAAAHLELGRRRAAGQTLVKAIVPPTRTRAFGSAVLLFVTDDIPFLVDTVRMVLDRRSLGIELSVHPMLSIVRDGDDELVEVVEKGAAPPPGTQVEAWTQIRLNGCTADRLSDVEDEVAAAIADVVRVVADFPEMRERLLNVGGDDALVLWLAKQHFVLLGAASYERRVDGGSEVSLHLMAGSELGEYRPDTRLDATAVGPPSKVGDVEAEPVVIARTEALSTIHRSVRLTSVAIRRTRGDTVIEERFIGLLGSGAYRESVFAIPVLQDRATALLELYGAAANSYTGRAIKNVVETLPRDVVFELAQHELASLVIDIVGLQERSIVRVFDVAEPVGSLSTVFVYLPQSRFVAGLQDDVADLVADHYGGDVRDVETLVGSSSLARISMTVRTDGPVDLDRLAEIIDGATASWHEQARQALVARAGAQRARAVFDLVGAGIERDYQARVQPACAVDDLLRVASLIEQQDESVVTSMSRSTDPRTGEWRFKVFRRDHASTIAELVPQLAHLGLHAVEEHPSEFVVGDDTVRLYDVGVRLDSDVEPTDRQIHEVQLGFRALLHGDVEADGLNRLVLAAGVTIRQVAVLRTYSRYLQQAGFPFSQKYIEEVLVRLAPITSALLDLFAARFDPASEPNPTESAVVANALRTDVLGRLERVPSLDDDRICRAVLVLIDATTRTNAYRPRPDGALAEEIAVKLDAASVGFLPEPRPTFEIFVCSPRVEGVHLRAGAVSRGGLRWSDRREDFRTEVLGLVKAQMVKNAVIVPVGAKGGFVIKQSTALPSDRDAVRAEGVDRYQRFIRSLLDVTDNLVAISGGAPTVVHPPGCVIYDDDDPYLVVAADKGTATFSDIANEVANDYGFWLGDAFASGGSNGYDHKAMGITARGAWESVRCHARAMGKDVETDSLTAVGVGDMSGDVFGNGMLLSKHLELVAAFDHRDIFLDPNPNSAISFAERQRLFELSRSSWADYDTELISEGGGVYSRSLKSIPISDQVRAALGLAQGITELAPNALLSSVLRAPVELLWNGGIGTYVKASTETHESVGDRSNDAIRIDGADLRCRIVGEGGNLGLTQLGRVEYAMAGGLIYTDAIDNSAGVDCSDHEVNIKIALAGLVANGDLSSVDRNALLEEMTDEVAELVLDDNRAQTLALMIARTQSLPMVNAHARYLDALEDEGHLDRGLEALPNDKQIAERQSGGSGLRAPEFAVMIALTKNADIQQVVASNLPDEAILEAGLFEYFPRPLGERFPEAIRTHRLRREIIATDLVNNMVNLAGISFDHRMTEQSGASVADVARAFVASRNTVGFTDLWWEIDSLGSSVDLDVQIELFLDVRRMAERSTTWLLRRRHAPIDIAAAIDTFSAGFGFLSESLDEVVGGRVATEIRSVREKRIAANVPPELAARSARWPWLHTSFDIIEIAHAESCNVADAATAYWSVFESFDVGWLWDGIGALPRSDRWKTQARASLRDDLMTVLADLTAHVIRTAEGSPEAWIEANRSAYTRMIGMETEIRRAESFDLTTLSVALRQLRNLTVNAAR
ncbi:MAG: glutamate dehydrogenase [Ilumatobacter sp.]|jgi:glutamate dehydrogenase